VFVFAVSGDLTVDCPEAGRQSMIEASPTAIRAKQTLADTGWFPCNVLSFE
jgi:hypothetical protein